MRLWHKDLISVLPKKQLSSQWRECCCIARNIAVNGTPNHLLVNKVLDYDSQHLHFYAGLIHDELLNRGYKCDYSKFDKWLHLDKNQVTFERLFIGWHRERYFWQCYYNLQEKCDCGGITADEWKIIAEKAAEIYDKQ